MGVRIEYGGVALGAKEDFRATVSEQSNYSNVSQLEKDGLSFANYGNPCELYSVVLDGETKPIPSDLTEEHIGWWSEQISREDGTFDNPIVAEFSATNYYTSSGITLVFDAQKDIYATSLNIDWYKDSSLIESQMFYPDQSSYFCSKKVEGYNKIVITFYSINMPFNRLRLQQIFYGLIMSFYGNELMNARLIQEINPISEALPISVCDIMINSKKDIEYIFEEQQPISIYFDEELKASTFITSAYRRSKKVWNVKTEDYIGILDDVPYHGGVYVSKNAEELLSDIFDTADVPYSINEYFSDKTVTGYIPYTSCREALMQVVFVLGAVVNTSNRDVVSVDIRNDDVTQIIGSGRIMQTQRLNQIKPTTSIQVFSHHYQKNQEEIIAFEASKSGMGEKIMVLFQEPLHSLSITDGEILEQSNNHAVINARENCVMIGLGYTHDFVSKSKHFDATSERDNIVSIRDATLVTDENIDNVLDLCYNYYRSTKTISAKIINGKREKIGDLFAYGAGTYNEYLYGTHKDGVGYDYDEPTNVGDIIGIETEYSGELVGRITKQTFGLNGGILVKDSVIEVFE